MPKMFTCMYVCVLKFLYKHARVTFFLTLAFATHENYITFYNNNSNTYNATQRAIAVAFSPRTMLLAIKSCIHNR